MNGERWNLFGPSEPQWHRTVRTLFIVAFVLVWLESMACFICFSILTRGASPVATPEFSASVVDHNNVCYIAAWQKQLYELMLTTMKFAIPGIMLTGFLLHCLIGVKIFTGREQHSRF
jgi:hypothetical protein